MQNFRYALPQVAIHWLAALLIVFLLVTGTFVLADMPNTAEKIGNLRIHLILGGLAGILVIARIIMRSRLPAAPAMAGDRLAFLNSVEKVFQACCPDAPDHAQLGAVSFVHRFGSALNGNSHFHCCVIDGVFSTEDETLRFDEAASHRAGAGQGQGTGAPSVQAANVAFGGRCGRDAPVGA